MIRTCSVDGYNWEFNTNTGFFKRWGWDENDDPQMAPPGPEIMDICVSKRCRGVGKPCDFCYQKSGPYGPNMSFETYKTLFAKLPLHNLTQVALGTGDLYGNPDLFKIMRWTRQQGIIPNITIHGYDLDHAGTRELAELAGAVAVSRYTPKDVCYDAVKLLTDAGLRQVNIHMLTAKSTLADCFALLDDASSDPRLAHLNAVVFLTAKQKGRGVWLEPVSLEKYAELVRHALAKGAGFGFDSCSAWKFLAAVKDSPLRQLYDMLAEPCESSLFSGYIDVDGFYYPCSLSTGLVEGIDLSGVDDFARDVWHSDSVKQWRKRLLENGRRCPLFQV